MQQVIDERHLADTDAMRRGFEQAEPFRHLAISNFLTPGFYERVKAEFPTPNADEMLSEFGDASSKHTVESILGLGPAFREWDGMLRSVEFIGWLEAVTGIEGLIFDPAYVGAGTHNNLHGQSLDLHIDFNHHQTTRYHRRLNLIVYINDEWDEKWGGAIELHRDAWDRSDDAFSVSYQPGRNFAVLFETNEHSWHGFKQIDLPENKRHLSRKSLTVYYYSKNRPSGEQAPDHSTIYVPDWIPEVVKPGEMLTEAAYRELELTMTRRDHYLRRLYARETDLQERYVRVTRVLQPLRNALQKLGLLGLARLFFRRE